MPCMQCLTNTRAICSGSLWAGRNVVIASSQTELRRKRTSDQARTRDLHSFAVHKAIGDEGVATGTMARVAEAPRKSVGPGFELDRWSFFSCRLFPEQCLWRGYCIISNIGAAPIEVPPRAYLIFSHSNCKQPWALEFYFRRCLNYCSGIGNWRPRLTTLTMSAQRTTSPLHSHYCDTWEEGGWAGQTTCGVI